jgi:hypothetical protein
VESGLGRGEREVTRAPLFPRHQRPPVALPAFIANKNPRLCLEGCVRASRRFPCRPCRPSGATAPVHGLRLLTADARILVDRQVHSFQAMFFFRLECKSLRKGAEEGRPGRSGAIFPAGPGAGRREKPIVALSAPVKQATPRAARAARRKRVGARQACSMAASVCQGEHSSTVPQNATGLVGLF